MAKLYELKSNIGAPTQFKSRVSWQICYTLNITTNLGPFFILQSYGYTHRERVLSPKVMYLMVRARRSLALTAIGNGCL